MAKITGPLHSDRVKGSVSGTTFREYRGMSTATRRARPVRRTSTVLSNTRSILGYLSRKWGIKPLVDRNAWTAYAQAHPRPNGMGGTFQLDGNQMFIALNHTAIRLLGWGGELNDPPIDEPPATVDTVVAVAGTNSGEILVTWTHLGSPVALDANEIWIAGPFSSAGRVSVGGKYRYWGDVAGDLKTATITGLLKGAHFWVQVRYTNHDGQLTNWVADYSKSKA